MGIPFTCPHCGHQTNVMEQYAGQTGPCSNCQQEVTIPAVVTPWVCPHCSHDMPAGVDSCTHCGFAYRQPLATDTAAYGVSNDAAVRMLIPVGRSAIAIIAGYAGLFAIFCWPAAPVAIILGILAINDLKKHPEKHGMGRAIFGIVMGCLGTIGLGGIIVSVVVG